MQYNICFLAAGSLLLVSENGNEQFKSKVNIEDESLKRCEKLAIATNLRNISDQSRYVFIRQLATRGDLSAFCVRRGKKSSTCTVSERCTGTDTELAGKLDLRLLTALVDALLVQDRIDGDGPCA